jgi:hypothetical protein
MGIYTKASDWEAVGVAQAGGVYVAGAGVYFFGFRSRMANCQAQFVFAGGALGLGGSLGGGSGPSPWDVINNTPPNMWTRIKSKRPFSADDLDWSYGALSTLGAAGAYGYFLLGIAAGLTDTLFEDQDVSGWGTGVGIIGAVMIGTWKKVGASSYS